MRYIDFDGVILDTSDLLFHEWRKNPDMHSLPEEDKVLYIKNSNWKYIIENSPIINDSIYILKDMDFTKSAILTKVHSLNEGYEKVIYLRKNGVKQDIFLVPYMSKKTDIVDPYGNILVDDNLKNLQEWSNASGYPMFFDLFGNNIDAWGVKNSQNYQRVRRIDEEIKRKQI